MSSAPVLRPLGVGEILDAALAVYRRHAVPLWRVVAVVVALPAALNGALSVAEHQVRDSNVQLGVARPVAAARPDRDADRHVPGHGSCLPLGRRCVPRTPGGSRCLAALRAAARRFGDVGVGPGRRSASSSAYCCSSCPAIYLAVAWAVAIPVLLGENLRGSAALRRSRALVRGRWWQCAGVLLLSFLLAAIVAAVITLVVAAIAGSSEQRHGDLLRPRHLDADRGHARAAVPGRSHDGALHRPPRAQGGLRRPVADALARIGRRGRDVRRLAVGLLTACALAAAGAPAAAESVDGATYQRLSLRRSAILQRSRGCGGSRPWTAGRPSFGASSPARPGACARVCKRCARLPGVRETPLRRAARPRRSWPAPTTGTRQPGLIARALSWLARLAEHPVGSKWRWPD